MQRANGLYPLLLSEDNLARAIEEVNASHRTTRGIPNRFVLWVEETKAERIKELRQIIKDGWEPKPMRSWMHYDRASGKWRRLYEPALWPDQYIHHALVQVLQPVMMRGMDKFCCGSIRGRGAAYGIHAIQHWMEDDPKGTKYAAEADIKGFYNNLKPEVVVGRFRRLVKEPPILALIAISMKFGVVSGAYPSVWYANTTLQPIDHYIRQVLHIPHYTRNMDNFTLMGPNKRQLHRAIRAIDRELRKLGLWLKPNWQVYRTTYTRKVERRSAEWSEKHRRLRHPRRIDALGYKHAHGYRVWRKKNVLRMRRRLAGIDRRLAGDVPIYFKTAAGAIAQIGQLKHCRSRKLTERCVKAGVQKELKNVVRVIGRRREVLKQWRLNTCLGQLRAALRNAATLKQKATWPNICRLVAISRRKCAMAI